jgi:hypothetical protein
MEAINLPWWYSTLGTNRRKGDRIREYVGVLVFGH